MHLDVSLKMGYAVGFYGINLPWFNKLISILGINPVGKHYEITENGEKYYYSEKTFRKFNGSIYEFAEGLLPDWITKSVGKIFGIQSIYTIALNYANKPMGTALVFNRQKMPPNYKDLEVFVDNVSKHLYSVVNDNIRNIDAPKVKDTFIKNMLNNLSHEIRTPLNGIMGLLQLVQEETVSSNSINAAFYRDAWSSAHTLTRNVDSLVLASELATQTLVLNKQIFSISKILEEVVYVINEHRSYNSNRDIIFNTRFDEKKLVQVDIIQFKYIVDELIRNSLKFSDNRIEIELKSDTNLSLQVKDYGIGLTEMELKVIFEHFAKVSYQDKIYRGMGLGLYNSHQLVTLFGGSLEMTSEYDMGTTVILNLPFIK